MSDSQLRTDRLHQEVRRLVMLGDQNRPTWPQVSHDDIDAWTAYMTSLATVLQVDLGRRPPVTFACPGDSGRCGKALAYVYQTDRGPLFLPVKERARRNTDIDLEKVWLLAEDDDDAELSFPRCVSGHNHVEREVYSFDPPPPRVTHTEYKANALLASEVYILYDRARSTGRRQRIPIGALLLAWGTDLPPLEEE